MARFWFGGGIADWTFTTQDGVGGFDNVAQVVGGGEVTFWNSEVGGTQHTDLLDVDGATVASITSSDGLVGRAVGQIPPFQGPDEVKEMWAEAGGGPRALLVGRGDAAQRAANLSDLESAAAARANLGLGDAATMNIGTTAGTVAQGNDSRLSDPRPPTAHAASHALGGADPVTPAAIGAQARGRLAQSMLTPVVIAGDSISSTGYGGVVYAAALGGHTSGTSASSAMPSQAGVAGNTSTQLLARFNTDVISKSPSLVHILIGTNDAGNSVPVSTFAANIRSMVAQCAAVGARVVLGTVPPTSSATPASRKAYVIAYNQWLCRYALSQGIQVADYYGALVNTATGGYQSAYDSGDGVHPSPAGISVMATELAASITRPPSPALLLTKDDPDPWNYVRNGLFLSSWATGWTRIDASTGVTLSTPSDSAIRGNWGKIAALASSGAAILNQNRTTSQGGTAYVAGNWTMLGARVQSSALSSGQYWVVKNKFVNVATMYLGSAQNKFCAALSGGLVLLQDSATSAASTANSSEVNLSAGSGDVSVAQVTVYDLTAMGVTDSSGNLV